MVEIAARIESGELASGSSLPSGDQLAKTLGVNRNSAHRAMEELVRLQVLGGAHAAVFRCVVQRITIACSPWRA